MVKKKNGDKKEKPSVKRTTKKDKIEEVVVDIEKYSITELLEKNKIKPLHAVGFLSYYGLTDDFRREFENGIITNKFSEGEFKDMYKRYNEREI